MTQNSDGPYSIDKRVKSPVHRRVPSWLWDKHKDVIEELYVQSERPKSLRELVKHMQKHYDFVATEKQYKDQLGKWNLKKKLSVPDAATVLHLIAMAEFQGVRREVFFNKHAKTRNDIRRYIKKCESVQSEAELIQHLPPESSWSRQITFEDTRTPSDNASTNQTNDLFTPPYPESTTTGAATKSTSSYVIVSQETPSKSTSSQEEVPNATHVPIPTTLSQSGTARSWNEEPDTSSSSLIQTRHAQSSDVMWADDDFQLPNNTSGGFEDLVGPMAFSTFEEPFLASQPGLEQLNTFMSSTPPALNEVHNDMRIEVMLGRLDTQQENRKRSPSRDFLRFCCMAAIYEGQECEDGSGPSAVARSSQALSSAVHTFFVVLNTAIDDSLTVLNNMVYLLSMYGQIELATNILKNIKESLAAEPHFTAPTFLLDTLNFMTEIGAPNLASLACYDLPRLEAAVEATSTIPHSHRLVLAARYNLAWAQLEMQQSQSAVDILTTILPDCEEVFGPHHVQTITCVSTLARAHLYTGRMVAGERLIDEVMGPRIEKAFARSHPLYWEFKNRQALFMRFRGNNLEGEEGARRRVEAEKLLRSVLEWRVANLGPNNQQTQRTFRVLKNFYVISEKFEEASGLHSMLSVIQQPEGMGHGDIEMEQYDSRVTEMMS